MDVDKKWMKNFTATLHAKNPPVKALLLVGSAASNLSVSATLPGNFKNYPGSFLRSGISAARDYKFDGIDFDWGFPASPQNMSNPSHLSKDLQLWAGKSSSLRLPCTSPPNSSYPMTQQHSYLGDAMRDYLNFVNMICFDNHENWDTTATAKHALLYDKASNISTSNGIPTGVKSGVPPENLDGSTVVYDRETVSIYSYAGTSWIGYDGPTSLENKVRFAKEQGLGGYFLWALGFNFMGKCRSMDYNVYSQDIWTVIDIDKFRPEGLYYLIYRI
ncbi:hypothetical protein BT93_C2465 [Corymbia citriodora subsp. variegata]|nr:hypothetical protein BT93_C2465 [Corymbia citriodora subsp. variegata]